MPIEEVFSTPHFDTQDQGHMLKLSVYVPGVSAHGVEITTRGPDLSVTARKTKHVRQNWHTMHLENAQRDYYLGIRLGDSFDLTALSAALHEGELTITVPLKHIGDSEASDRTVQAA